MILKKWIYLSLVDMNFNSGVGVPLMSDSGGILGQFAGILATGEDFRVRLDYDKFRWSVGIV